MSARAKFSFAFFLAVAAAASAGCDKSKEDPYQDDDVRARRGGLPTPVTSSSTGRTPVTTVTPGTGEQGP